MTSYESPSRRVSRESLGDWAQIDPLAWRALQSGMTEAELIHALLEDRQRLKERLAAALFTSPPPVVISEAAFKRHQARKGDHRAAPIDESDCFDCGLSQEEARDELQRIERSLVNEDAVADALEFMDEYGEVFKGLASGPET
jgi:NAD-dependent dihydropyrimidine dehydrogenase PreA subunit